MTTDDVSLTRRQVLHTGLAALTLAGDLGAAPEDGQAPFQLIETEGLRRFGYPVHAWLPSGLAGSRNFQLTRNGQSVPAQFRTGTGPDGRPAVSLDFNASPGPMETEEYIVSFGPGKEPAPEPSTGIKVEHKDGNYRVTNGPHMAYTVPDDLVGFLKGVGDGRLDYLRDFSKERPPGGLLLRDWSRLCWTVSGPGTKDAPFRATVAREGPLAVCLEFDCETEISSTEREKNIRSVVAMTFPSSKSWVETTWTVEDPDGRIGGLEVWLWPKVDGAPTLVDFGAGSTVYGTLKDREHMELRAGEASGLPADGRSWVVLKGPPDKLTAFAQAPRRDSPPAEGWAHVMDKTRCTAVAVADFGRSSRDRIEVDARGWLRVTREFSGPRQAPPRGTKSLTFWTHFVSMPVQIGAATSPQAMLAPLRVVWKDPGE